MNEKPTEQIEVAKAVAGDFIPSPNPYHRAWPLDVLRIAAALMVVAQHWSKGVSI